MRIYELLERISAEYPLIGLEAGAHLGAPPRVTRSFLLRFSARHTIALTGAFLIGLRDNSPALHAAI